MKRWPLGFLLVFALSAHAESYWDGNAAVQRGDAAFEAGMFAVSNAFARDTEILIEELASGKTTTARVTGRLDSQLDILVLLSPAAALPLGLEPGDVAFVRVTIKRTVAESAPILAEDTEPSADPDRTLSSAVQHEPVAVEPAEAEAEVAEAPAEEPAVEPAEAEAEIAEAPAEGPAVEPAEAEAEVAEAPAEAPAEEPAEAEAEVAEEPAVEAPVAVAPPGESVTSAEEAALLAGLAARTPQKQLFLPPREDEMFVYQEPVEPPAEVAAATVEAVEPQMETAPEIEPAAEGATPELVETLALAEPQPLQPAEPVTEPVIAEPAVAEPVVTEPAAAEPAVAAPVVAEPVVAEPVVAEPVVAEPTEAQAEAAKPAEAEAAVAAAKPGTVPTVLDLPGQGVFTWYLQLAAYSTEALARDTAARLSPTYPVLVLAPASGAKALYRVFVGPLNKAESGTLLTYFRHRGFPDAFVRTAQK